MLKIRTRIVVDNSEAVAEEIFLTQGMRHYDFIASALSKHGRRFTDFYWLTMEVDNGGHDCKGTFLFNSHNFSDYERIMQVEHFARIKQYQDTYPETAIVITAKTEPVKTK